MSVLDKTKKYIADHYRFLLILLIVVYVCIVSSFLIIKYNSFDYNAIDLAIYNQVFFNTAHGRLFEFSIHPHLYLGDHFEIFILFLTPLYLIKQSPITLLVLQVLFVAISVYPLYLIARRKLNIYWSLSISTIFLFNPFVLNLLFFEFHILAFAIPILLFVFYFYKKGGFGPYILFSILALLVREDVAWVVAMMGVLALLEKRKIKWILTPIIIGGAWFIGALKLSGYFNHYGSYKFLYMYSWLGSTPQEMLTNFFTHPWLVLRQIISFNNLLLIIGLSIPLTGLPFLKLRYLVPATLIFVQFFLTTVSTTIVLETHYTALFLPFLYIASIFALADLQDRVRRLNRLQSFIIKQKALFSAILLAATLYSFITFSPLLPTLKNPSANPDIQKTLEIKNEFLATIKPDDAVAAGYDYLPFISNRTNLYSMHYVFEGKKQYSTQPYTLPAETNKLLVDFSDFITYYLQSTENYVYKTTYEQGSANINHLLSSRNFGLKEILDDQAIYEKNYQSAVLLLEKNTQLPHDTQRIKNNSNDKLHLLGYTKNDYQNSRPDTIPLSLYWQSQQKLSDDYFLKLSIKNQRGEEVYQKIYPLDYGLYPTSLWSAGEIVKINHWFTIPPKYVSSDFQLNFQAIAIQGYLDLDGLRSAVPRFTKKETANTEQVVDYSTL